MLAFYRLRDDSLEKKKARKKNSILWKKIMLFLHISSILNKSSEEASVKNKLMYQQKLIISDLLKNTAIALFYGNYHRTGGWKF